MAVKDGERYLRQAIESILAQTFQDFEFIIIDDFSSDNSINIVQEYHDPRIMHVRNDTHSGLTASLNRGLDLARGKYIARMDADDVSLPGRFEAQVRYLDGYSDVAVLGTAIQFIDAEGSPLENVVFPTEHDVIKWSLCFYNPIAHPTVMMRAQVIQEAGGYNPTLERSQDYDLWWRIGSIGRLANLEDVYVQLRKHASQVTNIYRGRQFDTGLEINQKYLSELLGKPVTEEIIQKLWRKEILSLTDAISVSELIFQVFHRFDVSIQSKVCKQIITLDALSMILPILIPYLSNDIVWILIGKAFRLRPIDFIKIVSGVFAKSLIRFMKSIIHLKSLTIS